MKHLDLTLISQHNVNEDSGWQEPFVLEKETSLPTAACCLGEGLRMEDETAGRMYREPPADEVWRVLRSPHPPCISAVHLIQLLKSH